MSSPSTIAGLLALAATGLWVFAANAQAQAPALAEMTAWDRVIMESAFSRADTNEDGVLSRTEAYRLAAMAERFDALDGDHDGSLSLEEFAVGFAAPL
jgi:Ca2+-binding EF-hand superfamily protein